MTGSPAGSVRFRASRADPVTPWSHFLDSQGNGDQSSQSSCLRSGRARTKQESESPAVAAKTNASTTDVGMSCFRRQMAQTAKVATVGTPNTISEATIIWNQLGGPSSSRLKFTRT